MPFDIHRKDREQIELVLARVGDRWSMPIVRLLSNGSQRFNEIKRTLNGISQRMLTLSVRGLERDGLVKRTVYPTVPPRVDYELTDLGHSFWQPAQTLAAWAQQHRAQIEQAQQTYDLLHQTKRRQ